MRFLRHALPFALACALVLPSAHAAELVPPLSEMQPSPQRLAPFVQRYLRDADSVEHVHDIRFGTRREAALEALYTGWQARLAEIDYDSLTLEDRIDWQLLTRNLARNLRGLEFERKRYKDAESLLPRVSSLIDLAEARRALEYPDPQRSAQTLERARKAIADQVAALDAIEKDDKRKPTAILANRAAGILDATRASLKEWYGFHAGYDPLFTWWNRQPYEALDPLLGDYAKALRDRFAGGSGPESIVGDPIGREALMADLADELIDYTPDELVKLAERELAWCEDQMRIAAKEMGYADWKQALEAVKLRHVAPGEQPKLALELAHEAIEYVEKNDLVTVPELAKTDWRMTMLSPEAQLQAPFFLGGTDVWVAYPTDGMPFDKKMNALRGNNRHFSRAVVHHELIPGHHLQHFYNSRYQPHREQLSWTPFWGEGWALYWEFLLWDRGFAATPEDRIGMLFWRSHRAARILFSLGFHLGELTPQQAVQLLVDRVGHEPENAAAEVRRSLQGDYGPLYQAAYMLGGLQFYALHKELVDSGRMTDRAFHDAILKGGPMPVELVRARLLDAPPPRALKAQWRFYDLDGAAAR
ncbi:DUF885 family protein [Chiayiivirga flava]|uniref:DUF885 domain-containing protein n=1 Tax=Chiayiivirga flava TaxID=659595 RepID=A0A7W8FZL4_9GAMM|nr:DUF885 family protein [Chiayiivirga flava]MBB5208236.1 hypothetical protein [Chiayiivirga flava]